MPAPETVTIPGLQLEEEVGRGAQAVVFRARRNGAVYAVKLGQEVAPERLEHDLLRFRREAGALARLRHPAITRVLEVGKTGNRPYLVMEFLEGQTLAELLECSGALAESRVSTLARTLAAALEEVHSHGLVHRDLKPLNLFICSDGTVKLTDFGLAAYTGSRQDPNEVVGTFRYSSPEQTGVLKRPVDARSDLYSLGVILYQCVTGRPPFEAENPAELVRLHSSTVPDPPSLVNPQVGERMSATIMKLLAKDPDDRYASAGELLEELNRLAGKPGRHHVGSPSPLVGRRQELSKLESWLERARTAEGLVALVTGAAGVGKTRLTQELCSRAQEGGSLVLQGRCRVDDPLPLAPIREALERHLNALATLPSQESERAVRRIREAAGEYSPLLRGFCPALGRLLAKGVGVDPSQAYDQFYQALVYLLLRMAELHGHALLFIDDAQHLDEATLQVLAHLADQSRQAPLLTVLTARDEQSGTQHDLPELVGRIQFYASLSLEPLDQKSIATVIRAQLGGSLSDRTLVQRIADRCHGNLLVVKEYVRALLDAGHIQPHWGGWKVESDRLEELTLPEDVLELVARRAESLGDRSRHLLQVAAVVGRPILPEFLCRLTGAPSDEVFGSVTEAAQAGLLERLGSHYQFVHHQVREALLSTLDPSRRADHHEQVALALEEEGSAQPDQVFQIARHYAQGHPHRYPRRVYETNLQAGRMALEEFAHEDAYGFLSQAGAVAAMAGHQNDPAFEELMGDVCARTGRLAEAQDHLERSANASPSPEERARRRTQVAGLHLSNYDTTQATEELGRAFRDLGDAAPTGTPFGSLAGWLGRRVSRPDRAQRRGAGKVLAGLLDVAGDTAYFEGNPWLLLEATLRQMAVSRKGGHERIRHLCQASTLLATAGLAKAAQTVARRALREAESVGDPMLAAQAAYRHALTQNIAGRPRDAEHLLKRCLDERGRWLRTWDYLNGCKDLAWNLMIRGYLAEAWSWIDRGLRRARLTNQAREALFGHVLIPYAGAVLTGLGRAREGLEYLTGFQEIAEEDRRERYRQSSYLQCLLYAQLQQGELGGTVAEVAEQHRRLRWNPRFVPYDLCSFYVFHAYALVEQGHQTSAPAPPPAACFRELARAARTPSLRCHRLALEAARLGLGGQDERALKGLDQAERTARAVDNPWASFEIVRMRARILKRQGHRESSLREARVAHVLASEHGWVQLTQQVRREFALRDDKSSASSGGSKSLSGTMESTYAIKLQRYVDALLEVSLAAAQSSDPAHQARLVLDEIIRLLGAERGLLFFLEGQELVLEAARSPDRSNLPGPHAYSQTTVEKVRRERRALVLSGADHQELRDSESVIAHDLRSIIAAPLLVRDRLLGVVYLDNRLARGIFTESELEVLQALANQIAVGLESGRAVRLEARIQNEKEQRKLAEHLRDLTSSLSSTLELSEVLRRLLLSLEELIPVDTGEAWLVDESRGRRAALVGEATVEQEELALAEHPLLDETARSERPILVRDTDTDVRSGYGSLPGRSWIGIPISGGATRAVLLLGNPRPGAFAERDAELAWTFAAQAGIALENARLFGEVRRLATVDELTRVANRRAFFEQASRELQRAARYEHPTSAIMIDIDHFKSFNDRYGHAIGDAVLKEVAGRCQNALRTVDLLARYGGEEFAVLLPQTDLEGAGKVAERIRGSIADTPLDSEAGPLQLTISLGVAQRQADEDLEKLLVRADGALYEAKESGRNRYCFSPPLER